MLHKRRTALVLALSLPALAGCVQATRHSNTMVFGTNTSLAARVGQGVNQIPEVSVGYARQEAVIMPLLANTGDSGGRQGVLSPCSASVDPTPTPTPTPPPTTLPSSGLQPHPCKFVATKTNASGEIVSQDSYSVLASFGANIKARSPRDGSTGEIGVGLAQYFATGVAAQLLAANGGAAVVSVSAGATASAESTKTGAASAAVTGTKPVSADDIPDDLPNNYTTGLTNLRTFIQATTGDTDRVRKITYIYNNLDKKPPFVANTITECGKSVGECVTAVNGDKTTFFGSFNFKSLVDGWPGY